VAVICIPRRIRGDGGFSWEGLYGLLGVRVLLGVGVKVRVKVAVGELLGVREAVGEGPGVLVWLGMTGMVVGLGMCVGNGTKVKVGNGVTVGVGGLKTRCQRLSKADKPGSANRQQHGETDPPPASAIRCCRCGSTDFAPGANDIKANQAGTRELRVGGNQDCLKDGVDLHQSRIFPPR